MKNPYEKTDIYIYIYIYIYKYEFDWRMVIREKIMCPLIRGACFLECPLMSDFTVFVSFDVASHAWAGHQCSFCRTTSLVFVVPETILPF